MPTDPSAGPIVLVVEDQPEWRDPIVNALRSVVSDVHWASTPAEAAALLQQRYDLVVLDRDLRDPKTDGISILGWIREWWPGTPVIFVTVENALEKGVQAMRLGASDYLAKTSATYLQELVTKTSELIARPRSFTTERRLSNKGDIVGRSFQIEEVRRLIREFAPLQKIVLITGESGTGKELVAAAIHSESRRAGRFVELNCATIPEALFESELFGYKRGAFTGASADKSGAFKQADHGTLFLDEIGELPITAQAKLLKCIEDRRYRPLGAECDEAADARLVVATNRNLAQLVNEGEFREDLYYRLHVLPIRVPPLRERRDDIPVLVDFFVREERPHDPPTITSEAFAQLNADNWPGNVRELKNTVERTMALQRLGSISRFDLQPRSEDEESSDAITCDRLYELLKEYKGRLGPVARTLGVSIRTAQRRMVKCGFQRRDFI
jgi:DNA-binding NtrC family response regulator